MMKRLVLVVGLLISFCANSAEFDDWPWVDLEDETHLRELFRNYSDLVDPFSVEFRDTLVRTGVLSDGTQMTIWCGFSNQKNQMGGYTGWTDFCAVEGRGEPFVRLVSGDTAKFKTALMLMNLYCKGANNSTTDWAFIEQLQSSSSMERLKASERIFYARFDPPRFLYVGSGVYEVVAAVIRNQLPTLSRKTPRKQQEEIAWHSKALAASGNLDYIPLLEELSNSPASKVARYGKSSKKLLLETAQEK